MSRTERRLASKRDDFDALLARAITRTQQGRLEQAIELYRQALAVRPDAPSAHNNLGVLLKSVGRSREAATHFVAALKRNPKLADVHANLADTLTALGLVDEAMAHCREALALKPDLLAPRISLAMCLAYRGQVVEALEHAEIASWAEAQPSFPHFQFGVLMTRCNSPDAARRCFETYLASDPDDHRGARALLAKLGFAALPERASTAQLDSLYSLRAVAWDQGAAGYAGARLVADTLKELVGARDDLDILDAGCGTGLVGELLAAQARRLEGVDLSAPMLEKARVKGVYHQLQQGDLVAALRRREQSFDAVTCAATLIHFGALDAVFHAAAASLRDGGLLVFTLFPNEQDDDAVAVATLDGTGEGGCFMHGRGYVARVAAAAGFAVVKLATDMHEYAQGRPKMGLIVALRRDARAADVPAPSTSVAAA